MIRRGGDISGLIVISALLALFLSSCNVGEELDECATDGDCARDELCHHEGNFCTANTEFIRIGVLMPFSEQIKPYGELQYAALEHLGAHINEYGGFAGRRLEWVRIDDQQSEENLQADIRRLVKEEKLVAIIGGASSTSTLRAQKTTSELGILLFTPMATSPKITQAESPGDRYTFNRLPDIELGDTLGAAYFAASDAFPTGPGCRQVAIVRDAFDYSQGYHDGLVANFPRFGACVTSEVLIEPARVEDYTPILDTLATRGAECAFLLGSPPALAELSVQALAYPWPNGMPRWFSAASTNQSVFRDEIEALRPEVAPTVHGAAPSLDRTNIVFEDWYAEIANHLPDSGTDDEEQLKFVTDISVVAHTYDVGMIVALAILKATPTTGDYPGQLAIRDAVWDVTSNEGDHRVITFNAWELAMTQLHHPTRDRAGGVFYRAISGDIALNPKGFALVPIEHWSFENGDFVKNSELEAETQEARFLSVEELDMLLELEPSVECPRYTSVDYRIEHTD